MNTLTPTQAVQLANLAYKAKSIKTYLASINLAGSASIILAG